MAHTHKKPPEIIIKNGKPTAVILDIDAYQDILERLEDIEDLELLKRMRQEPLNFRSLDDILEELDSGV